MIHLRPDCLVFKMSTGENIPCSAEKVTIELMGESAELVDQELIKNAAESVLHYFKAEQQKTSVSVAEFALALEKVLRGLGLEVKAADAEPTLVGSGVAEANLEELARHSLRGFELSFFPSLRAELARHVRKAPQVVRFRGLRLCVKHLVGAKRWSNRCQVLSDQIVAYLRRCYMDEHASTGCALVID